MIYTYRDLRKKLKEALDKADEGEEVVIERRLKSTSGQPTKRYRIIKDVPDILQKEQIRR